MCGVTNLSVYSYIILDGLRSLGIDCAWVGFAFETIPVHSSTTFAGNGLQAVNPPNGNWEVNRGSVQSIWIPRASINEAWVQSQRDGSLCSTPFGLLGRRTRTIPFEKFVSFRKATRLSGPTDPLCPLHLWNSNDFTLLRALSEKAAPLVSPGSRGAGWPNMTNYYVVLCNTM